MNVEIMLDSGYNKIYKCGHYLFARDERTVVDGCAHTLYVIDLEYIPKNASASKFKYEFNPKHKYMLNFDLTYILENNEYESKIISNEEFIKNFDTGLDNKKLINMLCNFLDINANGYKIVQLFNFIEHHGSYEIRHGGTCIILMDQEVFDAETNETTIISNDNLNLLVNTNTLMNHYNEPCLQKMPIFDTDLLLDIAIELFEYYNIDPYIDLVHIVSEYVYNNYIKDKQVEVTLEDPDICKYIDLYDKDKYNIRNADLIMSLDGMGAVTKFSDFVNHFKSKNLD